MVILVIVMAGTGRQVHGMFGPDATRSQASLRRGSAGRFATRTAEAPTAEVHRFVRKTKRARRKNEVTNKQTNEKPQALTT